MTPPEAQPPEGDAGEDSKWEATVRSVVRTAINRALRAELDPALSMSLKGLERKRMEKRAAEDEAVEALRSRGEKENGDG
jgi:hypothetical protein